MLDPWNRRTAWQARCIWGNMCRQASCSWQTMGQQGRYSWPNMCQQGNRRSVSLPGEKCCIEIGNEWKQIVLGTYLLVDTCGWFPGSVPRWPWVATSSLWHIVQLFQHWGILGSKSSHMDQTLLVSCQCKCIQVSEPHPTSGTALKVWGLAKQNIHISYPGQG